MLFMNIKNFEFLKNKDFKLIIKIGNSLFAN